MTRKGKLCGSPFQVETAYHKHAIEHENDGYMIKNEKPECKYLNIRNDRCGLYNSGFSLCAVHKCKYFNNAIRRTAICDECVYFFRGRCAHEQGHQNIRPEVASYCCFFDDSLEKKARIQRKLMIAMILYDIGKYEKSIQRSKKYIRQATREIKLSSTSEQDRNYLINKIDDRKKCIANYEKQIILLKRELDTIK